MFLPLLFKMLCKHNFNTYYIDRLITYAINFVKKLIIFTLYVYMAVNNYI